MLVFGLGMGMQFVSLTLMAVSGVARRKRGAASGVLNATQQVGGSLGLSILVTMFGTASRHEATDQVPRFLEQATPAQLLEFRRTGELPPPWGNEGPHRRCLQRLRRRRLLRRLRRPGRPPGHPGPRLRPGQTPGAAPTPGETVPGAQTSDGDTPEPAVPETADDTPRPPPKQ
ncbi:hypothetical protein [Streptomyces sp. CYG21]|uniref:hypothetical protein n=1 Tax=Streptomyces sp. CYG21 TaxID=2838874 RepID=UPI0035AC13D1